MNTIRLKGRWNILKGKIRQRCAWLLHDASRYAHGREDELIGHLQRRLGKSRKEVEQMLGVHHARRRTFSGARPGRHD